MDLRLRFIFCVVSVLTYHLEFSIGFDVIYTINTPDCGSTSNMFAQAVDLRHYGLQVGNKTSFIFKVKAPSDISIYATDTPNPRTATTFYCFYIGGNGNQWCKIRLKREGIRSQQKQVYGNYANATDYKQFWFSWRNGEIRGGLGEIFGLQTFIEWNDSSSIDVKGLGIATCWGADGSWKIKVEVEDEFKGYFNKCKMTGTRTELLHLVNISTSKTLCAVQCSHIRACFGFNYHEYDGRCELLSIGMEPLEEINRTWVPGWNFYAKCYMQHEVCVGCFF